MFSRHIEPAPKIRVHLKQAFDTDWRLVRPIRPRRILENDSEPPLARGICSHITQHGDRLTHLAVHDRDRRPKKTKASFKFTAFGRGTFTEAEHVMSALVTEVSILSPGTESAEPLACVTFLRTAEAATPVEELYGGGPLIRPNVGQVTAIGGRALRTRQGNPIRYVGDDIFIDLPDGRQEIYCGREGRAEAIRAGVLGVR